MFIFSFLLNQKSFTLLEVSHEYEKLYNVEPASIGAETMLERLIETGHVEVLENIADLEKYKQQASKYAATYGHLTILQWIKKKFGVIHQFAPAFTVINKHFTLFLWLYRHHKELFTPTCLKKVGFLAIKYEDYDFLTWFLTAQLPLDADLLTFAGLKKDFKLMTWFYDHGYSWSPTFLSLVVASGHLAVCQWAVAHGCPLTERATFQAARNGHLELLQWLHANHCPWDKMTFTFALERRHKHITDWLMTTDCPIIPSFIINTVIKQGDLALLQWLTSLGVQPSVGAYQFARDHEQIKVAQWLRNNGY